MQLLLLLLLQLLLLLLLWTLLLRDQAPQRPQRLELWLLVRLRMSVRRGQRP